jgi:tripartite-type tricarboxylate transporter receptor subunit TctC
VVAAAKGGQKLRFGAMTPKMADIAYLLGKKHGIEFNIVSTKGGKGVMNGLNAGDLDLGFMAGIQAKAVLAGEMVNLVSGETVRLQVSPDAPTLKELGLDYWAGAYFLVFGPAGMSDEARSTIAKAITDITSDPATKAGGFVKKAFGGPVSIQGAELDAALTSGVTEAERLLKDASE